MVCFNDETYKKDSHVPTFMGHTYVGGVGRLAGAQYNETIINCKR